MRMFKTLSLLVVAASVVIGCQSPNPFTTKPLGLGWNLACQFDVFSDSLPTVDETFWGNQPVTKAAIDSVKAAGFQSVRIPVTWFMHSSATLDRTIDPAFLQRLDEVLDWCEADNLKVIMNVAHDGLANKFWVNINSASKSESANDSIKLQLKNLWHQIAEHFKDRGNFLMFETLNEIHDGGWGWGNNLNDDGHQYDILNSWNQLIVDEIRSTGGNNEYRWIGVPSYSCSQKRALDNFTLPDDPANRTMVSIHFYEPIGYAIEMKYSEWGKDADPEKAPKYGDEQFIDSVFNLLEQKFVKNDIPLYIGQFGAVRRYNDHDEAMRMNYLATVCRLAKKHNLSCMYWDNGYSGAGLDKFGLINHSTGEFLDNSKAIINAMVDAYKD